MNLVHHDIRLDVLSPGSQAAIYAKQSEQASREIRIELYQGSEPYDLSDCIIAMGAKRGETIYGFTSTTVEGNLVKAYVPAPVCNVAGSYTCELHIYGGDGGLLYSPQFTIYVKSHMIAPNEVDEVTPAQDLSAIANALTQLAKWASPAVLTHSGAPAAVDIDTDGERVAFRFTLEPGPKGDKGDPGPQGKGWVVLGYYPDLATLTASVRNPEPGDTYGVGLDEPYDYYVFDGVNEIWVETGTHAGPPGPNEVSASTKTNLSGILRGTGDTIAIARPGIDYQYPITTAGILKGSEAGVVAAVPGVDYQAPIGVVGILKGNRTGVTVASNMVDYVGIFGNAGFHNSIYRGKNLGTSVTAAQWAAIAAGTFDDMFIGDYWEINGVIWRISAFNYYYGTGDQACNIPHIVIVPDSYLYYAKMNSTNTTNGGYVGSEMYTVGLAEAKTMINSVFGAAHILSHRQYFCNAVTDGVPSGGAWVDSTVDLMCERNLYGSNILAPATDGTTSVWAITVDKNQFPLFMYNPQLISMNNAWLRDITTDKTFASITAYGYASRSSASSDRAVRPAFCICA